MARVLFIVPWNFHDEGRTSFDLAYEWRNGPYNLLLLGTILRQAGHQVKLADLHRDLVVCRGSRAPVLDKLERDICSFKPDIIAISFFSIHYFEVKDCVAHARRVCQRERIPAVFIAGGIHASVEPQGTLDELDFDFAFVGEGDVGLLQFANGADPREVPGLYGRGARIPTGCEIARGQQVAALDSLPFPDWSLCDHRFYSYPSYARVKIKKTGSLDLIMGRGCVYKCAFCAYNALSSVRFYSAEYLVDQIDYMHREFEIDSVYFTDSTIGNNRRLIREFCELMLRRDLASKVSWLANIRPNQVNEELLLLMQRAGCTYLLYGIETNSQRMLDAMDKGTKVEHNEQIVGLHEKLRFPYNASFLIGYPGETEADIRLTIDFMRRSKAPSIGVNWYVPLPGSPDYDALKEKGVIKTDDPYEWRRIGEVNSSRCYADVEESRFRELYAEACHVAYSEVPGQLSEIWHVAPATELPGGQHPGLRQSYPFNFRRRLVHQSDLIEPLDPDDDAEFSEVFVLRHEFVDWKAGDRIVYRGATAEDHDGVVSVKTADEPWSYALGFPLSKLELSDATLGDTLIIRIEASVEQGVLGAMIVDKSLTGMIGAETRIEAAAPTACFEILLKGGLPLGSSLVLRNASVQRMETKFRLSSIRFYAGCRWDAGQQTPQARAPELSPPA